MSAQAEKMKIDWVASGDTWRDAGLAGYVTGRVLPLLLEKSGGVFDLRLTSIDEMRPGALPVYQLGGGPEDAATAEQLKVRPGIVWFHDVYREDAGTAVPGTEAERANPNLRWAELRAAKRCLFSSLRGLENALRHIPELRRAAAFLPIPVTPEPERILGNTMRREADRRPVVAMHASPAVHEHAHQVFAALRDFPQPYLLRWLIDNSERMPAEELINEFAVSSVELICGREPDAWRQIAAGSDIGCELNFSGFGGVGPYLPLSLMQGLPVIGLDFAECGAFPAAVLYKVQPGAAEIPELRAAFQALLIQPDAARLRQKFADSAREFALEMFDCRNIAAELLAVISQGRVLR